MRLGIQGNRHAIGIIGAGVVVKDVFKAKDGAIFFESYLAVVYLIALGRRCQEIFPPVFHPFDRTVQLLGNPGEQNIICLRTHHFRSKSTANEWSNDMHLALCQPQQS